MLRRADGELHTAWRIVFFLLVGAGCMVVASVLTMWLAGISPTEDVRLFVFSLSSVVALLVAHFIALHWIDAHRPWSFVGLGREQARPKILVKGFALGALAIGIPSLLLLFADELRVVSAPSGSWWGAAARSALVLIPAALFEELALRGYIFAVLRESIGWKWTLIGTSIAFGVLHLNNPGADPQSTLLVIIAGFFLGTILLITRSLYAAWLAHFAWNWVMAAGLHTAVSGLGLASPSYKIVDAGPDWLTGGAWGPEGGIAAGLSMTAFLMYFFARHLKTLGPK